MTMMTTIVGARGRAAADLGATLRSVLAVVVREIRIRRDVAFLMQLDERMLQDIGLSRCDGALVHGGR